ncbi:unnamed protein product [Boreogadus saida]
MALPSGNTRGAELKQQGVLWAGGGQNRRSVGRRRSEQAFCGPVAVRTGGSSRLRGYGPSSISLQLEKAILKDGRNSRHWEVCL